MSALVVVPRALRVCEHVLTGSLLASVARLARLLHLQHLWVPAATCWWHRRLCWILQLQVEVTGVFEPGALLVANHVSWLDIPTVGAHGTVAFVSKEEIRHWPIIGGLAQAAGTLFIKRGGNQAADLIEQIGKRIDSGSSVLIFPEGTTGDGYALRRFYPRLFAAVQANAGAVQPVAIRYGSNAEPDPVAPFIDNDSLAIHLLRVLRNPGIHVHIAFLPPIDPTGHDRRSMADVTRAAIAARLGLGEQPAQYVKLPRVQTASRTSASR